MLPEPYGRWVAGLLGTLPPEETAATCETCAMVCGEGESAHRHGVFFDAATRCCTYVPDLANYLVGGILSDDSPGSEVGRASVERRLRTGLVVTPLGLRPSPVFHLLYANSVGTFGRSAALGCPYLDADSRCCSIWAHREPTCATWFCKHDRGALGRSFWRGVLACLRQVQGELSIWCALELGVGPDALRTLMGPERVSAFGETIDPNVLEDRADPADLRGIWGTWWQREREFFREAARLVLPLTWADVSRICGPHVEALARVVRVAHQELLRIDLPDPLVLGRFEVVAVSPRGVRVRAYSPFDPVDLPQPLFQALTSFDGRPNEDALVTVAKEFGVRIDPRTLRNLVDLGVLAPAG